MAGVYNRAKKRLLDGSLNFASDTIKVMLVTNAYAFNADHDFVNQVSAAEVAGSGYTGGFAGSGRKTLGSKVVNEDDAGDRGYFDAADVTWSGINVGSVQAAVLYEEGTSDADSSLIAYIDSGGFPVVTNGGDFVIQWSPSPVGILQLT